MIVAQLKGGHSNQLFQYSAARRIAHKLGTRTYMDKSWFSEIEAGDTERVYELGNYNFAQNFIAPDKLVLANDDDKGLKIKLYSLTKGRVKPRLEVYQEKSLGFDKHVLSLGDNIYLQGYWQNENYFKDIRPLLLKEVELTTKPNNKNSEWLNQIKKSRSVSIHIRRGDYVENKLTNKFHGIVGPAYYQEAIDLLAKKTGDDKLQLFIFSNDIDWCKKNLKFNFPTVFIDGNNSGAEDMRLMKYCKHNIMANSSFSWWGAWLNQNPYKIIIAPRVWFQDKKADSETKIVPKDWIRL